jgi:hypothetical protein
MIMITSAVVNAVTTLLATYCLGELFRRKPSEGVNILITILAGLACAAILRGAALAHGSLWPVIGLGADVILLAGVAGVGWALLRKRLYEESQ